MGFFLILVLLFGAKFSCQRWSYDYWYFFKFLFYYLGQNSIERDGQMTKSILSEFLFYFLGQNSVVRSGQMTIRFFLNFCSIFWGKIQFSEMVKWLLDFFWIFVPFFGAKFSSQKWSNDYWNFSEFMFYFLGQNLTNFEGGGL